VPAGVTFSGHPKRSCRAGTAGANMKQVFRPGRSSRGYEVVIHPAALPTGIGIQMGVFHHSVRTIKVGLVHASPHCTGS
jgi:hypothetical protein